MSAPLNVSKPAYGEGQKVEQAQKTTKQMLKAKTPAAPVEPAAAPVAPEQALAPGFAGPQGMLDIPQAPPTYQAPFKTEMEKNQEVATMFDILAEKSPTWQAIIDSLRGG